MSSIFTDSAVSLDTRSLDMSKNQTAPAGDHDDDYRASISAQLNQLAAVAWAIEEEEGFERSKRCKIEHTLCELEAVLNDDESSSPIKHLSVIEDRDESAMSAAATERNTAPGEPRLETVTEADLEHVQHSLSVTVASMRMRLEEQRHLNDLTVRKLEGVAQKCLQQERALEQRQAENAQVQQACIILNKDNEGLRQRIAELESESLHKEVAVDAMSSAVAGLEGWINSRPVSREPSPIPPKPLKKTVIRGRGRFRGKYLLDEQPDLISAGGELKIPSEEFRDGVRAWLRGFRDVEEELRSSRSSDRVNRDGRDEYRGYYRDEDWGDFVTVSQVN